MGAFLLTARGQGQQGRPRSWATKKPRYFCRSGVCQCPERFRRKARRRVTTPWLSVAAPCPPESCRPTQGVPSVRGRGAYRTGICFHRL